MYTIFFTSTLLTMTLRTTSGKNSDASVPFDIIASSHFMPFAFS